MSKALRAANWTSTTHGLCHVDMRTIPPRLLSKNALTVRVLHRFGRRGAVAIGMFGVFGAVTAVSSGCRRIEQLPTPTPAELTRCDTSSGLKSHAWPRLAAARIEPRDWCGSSFSDSRQLQALRCGDQRVVRVSFDRVRGVDLFYAADGTLAGLANAGGAHRVCSGTVPSKVGACTEDESIDCAAWRRDNGVAASPPPEPHSDPGWLYMAPGGRAVMDDGQRWVMPSAGGVGLRVHASVFAGSMSIELDLTNEVDTPLALLPDRVTVLDANGNDPRFRPGPLSARCESGKTELARGESCRVSLRMNAPPDPVRMRTLTVAHGGVRRGNDAIPIRVALEIDTR